MTHYQRALRNGSSVVAGERVHNFVASSPEIARDGLVLRGEGWMLDNFRSNPVILWAHDYRSRPPIGRAVDSDQSADGLRLSVVWDQADEFARQVESKYETGFLNAVSVGWDWVDEEGRSIDMETWWTTSDEELARDYFYDLLETSAVPVPADPKALIERTAAGLATLRSWGYEPIDPATGPEPERIPPTIVEPPEVIEEPAVWSRSLRYWEMRARTLGIEVA